MTEPDTEPADTQHVPVDATNGQDSTPAAEGTEQVILAHGLIDSEGTYIPPGTTVTVLSGDAQALRISGYVEGETADVLQPVSAGLRVLAVEG